MPTAIRARGYRAIVRARARDWRGGAAPLHAFGGRPLLEARVPPSGHSGTGLHLTLDLDLSDERLRHLGITTVDRLAVLASLGAVEGAPLIVRHARRGRELELLDEPPVLPCDELPGELPQLPVDLVERSEAEAAVETVAEMPDLDQPLHQVGGHPVWITRPIPAPRCPVTGRPMRYVATVDSMARYPLADGETRLLFADQGALYVFWSDEAAVSAAIIQSA